MSSLPIGEPPVTHDSARFWQATAAGRIDLPRCRACGLVIYYPRPICPDCHRGDLVWETMAGTGTVYSYTITRRGLGSRWREHLPIVLAYVQLDEGPIMLTNIVDVDPDQVRIDMAVVAVFDDTGHGPEGPTGAQGSGWALVRFRPVEPR